MKAVLYTYEAEPITVIRLPSDWQRHARDGYFFLAVMFPLSRTLGSGPRAHSHEELALHKVCIEVEPLWRNGKQWSWMFLVQDRDVSNALALNSDVLPGQQRAYNERFLDGFITR